MWSTMKSLAVVLMAVVLVSAELETAVGSDETPSAAMPIQGEKAVGQDTMPSEHLMEEKAVVQDAMLEHPMEATETVVAPDAMPTETRVVEPFLLSVYAAPRFNLDSSLYQERNGVTGMFDKPFFAALKVAGKNEIDTFLLKDGLGSLSNMEDKLNVAPVTPAALPTPPTALLRDAVLSSNRIGIMLSAARYLQLPEMAMPITRMMVPQNFTLDDVFQISQDYPLLPWMYLANREDLPSGVLDKLIQVGQFAVSNEKLEVARDFLKGDSDVTLSMLQRPEVRPTLMQPLQGLQGLQPVLPLSQRFYFLRPMTLRTPLVLQRLGGMEMRVRMRN